MAYRKFQLSGCMYQCIYFVKLV